MPKVYRAFADTPLAGKVIFVCRGETAGTLAVTNRLYSVLEHYFPTPEPDKGNLTALLVAQVLAHTLDVQTALTPDDPDALHDLAALWDWLCQHVYIDGAALPAEQTYRQVIDDDAALGDIYAQWLGRMNGEVFTQWILARRQAKLLYPAPLEQRPTPLLTEEQRANDALKKSDLPSDDM